MDTGKNIENQDNMENKETKEEALDNLEREENLSDNSTEMEQENIDPNTILERDYEKELKEINDKYLRLFAEFENFKKRSLKERIELFKTAGKDVIVSLLPVLDDFDRALKAMENVDDNDPSKAGILLIKNKLFNSLSQKGLKEMPCIGEVFNTDLHEAITQVPATSEDMKGKVMDQMEKGYLLNDVVIRFAKVIVGI